MPYHLGNPVNLNNDYSYNNTNVDFKRLLDLKEQDLKYSNSRNEKLVRYIEELEIQRKMPEIKVILKTFRRNLP